MRFSIVLIALVLFSGCEFKPLQMKPPLKGEGEVYLYIEPFPQEAERLRFFLDAIFAVKDDGTAVPLTLSIGEFRNDDMKRQRILASGRLPQGSYSGLSFVVKRALLKGEEGEGDLLVPKQPSKVSFPFSVPTEKAVLISMTFRYAESVKEGVQN